MHMHHHTAQELSDDHKDSQHGLRLGVILTLSARDRDVLLFGIVPNALDPQGHAYFRQVSDVVANL